MNRITNIIALAGAAALAACGGTTQSANDAASTETAPTSSGAVATRPVHVRAVSIKGALLVTDDSGQRQLAAAAATTATALTTTGQGAIVDVGSSGRLWLRGGTSVKLGRDSRGALHLTLQRGEVRFLPADGSATAYVHTRAEPIAVGRDVVLRASGAGGVVATATEHEPTRAVWSLALEQGNAREPVGIGSLEARGAGKTRVHLELKKLTVRVKTAGDLAITEVEHEFYNSSNDQLEGTFRFPMPDGAMLLGLAMEIHGEMMQGELVERKKARQAYQTIVDQMQDPALLEWQQGRWFKLRVFPIEAKKTKRVVLRYASPLRRNHGGFEYVYATAGTAMQTTLPVFSLQFNGTRVVDNQTFPVGQDVVVPVTSKVPRVTREVRKDGTYTFARVSFPWTKLRRTFKSGPTGVRRTVIVFDTSRSSLESRKLALEILATTLDQLSARQEFVLLAADVTVRRFRKAPVRASAANIARAMMFIKGIEPDGASDLATALRLAGGAARNPRGDADIIYIGDGTPTWGKTDDADVTAAAASSMGGARLHAALLGRGASSDLWRGLVARFGGRLAQPRSLLEAKQFAFVAARTATTPRLDNVVVQGPKGAVLYPQGARAVFAGDDLGVVLKTTGKLPPKSLTVNARLNGKPVRYHVSLAAAKSVPHVSQRWAIRHMHALMAADAKREDIVKLSLAHQVMSRYTSFLVLESEEAYKRFKIKRHKQQLAAKSKPTVTGGDLDSVAGNRASLSPNEFQPGDPEIRIPAPADARAVVVVFPFGDTKIAHYDADQRVWLVRFLIDKATADGTYFVLVKITHADGRVQSIKLPYVVDTRPPTVNVTVKRLRAGRYLITVKQKANAIEMSRVAPNWRSASVQVQKRVAKIARDVGRVEVALPNGRILRLRDKGAGVFRRVWRLRRPLRRAVKLRVVATDRAQNHTTVEVEVQPKGAN